MFAHLLFGDRQLKGATAVTRLTQCAHLILMVTLISAITVAFTALIVAHLSLKSLRQK